MSPINDEQLRQLMEAFRIEAAEHIQHINKNLLALEKRPTGQKREKVLEEIFREAHSLKGAARAVDLQTIAEISHRMEDIFGAVQRDDINLNDELFDLLYQAADAIEESMNKLAGFGTEAETVDIPDLLANLTAAMEIYYKDTVEEVIPSVDKPEEAFPSSTKVETPAIVESKEVQPRSAPSSPPAEKIEEIPVHETIRVATDKLDDLMGQIGELLVNRIRMEQQLVEAREMYKFVEQWQKEWLKTRSFYNKLVRRSIEEPNYHVKSTTTPAALPFGSLFGEEEILEIEERPVYYSEQPRSVAASERDLRQMLEFLDINHSNLRSLQDRLDELVNGLSEGALRLGLITNDLQDSIKKVRMLPFSTISDTFERMVRDLARERGKEVIWEVIGADTEVDKHILEEIKDPLIHIIRNSVDHGIENPAERVAHGKERQGRLTLTAAQQGNNIVIEVTDDGAGIDVEMVKRVAQRRGFISNAQAKTMTDREALGLIFTSGLSTSPIITSLSGRGVGLDVVRNNLENLQGQVEVDSELGKSTTFTLTLPLTLTSTRGLLVKVLGQTYAIPITNVERLLRITQDDVALVEGRRVIHYQNRPISLVHMADVLELSEAETSLEKKTPVVLLGVAEKRVAFIIDRVAGEQEIVIKNLGTQLARVRNIAGATILGTGRIVLILNISDLIKSAQRIEGGVSLKQPRVEAEAGGRKRILVVDDSVTTRTLEKNILTAAGYDVELATDGQEALEVLEQSGSCDLIVSDVLMPRLSGFEFTKRVKEDSRFEDIPVILVTSLESQSDKIRGIEVGADAYIVKSKFDQENLLETINQLV